MSISDGYAVTLDAEALYALASDKNARPALWDLFVRLAIEHRFCFSCKGSGICPTCHGSGRTGRDWSEQSCPTSCGSCQGTGFSARELRIINSKKALDEANQNLQQAREARDRANIQFENAVDNRNDASEAWTQALNAPIPEPADP